MAELFLYFVGYTFVTIILPWLIIAALAGYAAYSLSIKYRRLHAVAAVISVLLSGATTAVFHVENQKNQVDSLHFAEAAAFCRKSHSYVRKTLDGVEEIKFGVYDNQISPGNFTELDFELRSRQTSPNSPLRRITLVALDNKQKPLKGVYPLMRRATKNEVNLSVISPESGETIAYSNFIREYDGTTGHWYVGCNRELSRGGPSKLEYDELFALLLALVPADSAAAPSQATRARVLTRKYDIEADRFHDIREDCSFGLTIAPDVEGPLDVRYLRQEDDLVVLVLDRKSHADAENDKAKLALAYQRPIYSQHIFPVVTCRNYFSDDTKAGPVLHSNGYEEPASRIRHLSDHPYLPMDFGPHRSLVCSDKIVAGTTRPPWQYILKREGQDLVVADYYQRHGETTKVTPLFTCKGYFDSDSSVTPDVEFGSGGTVRKIVRTGSEILRLSDGQYLLPTGERATVKLAQVKSRGGPAIGALPAPAPSSQPASETSSNWPVTPRR